MIIYQISQKDQNQRSYEDTKLKDHSKISKIFWEEPLRRSFEEINLDLSNIFRRKDFKTKSSKNLPKKISEDLLKNEIS